MENKQEIVRMVGSSDAGTRLKAWGVLWTIDFDSKGSLEERIKRYLWYESKHEGDAEDLTQETFIKMLVLLGNRPLSPAPEAYAWSVARTLLRDLERMRRKMKVQPQDWEVLDKKKSIHATEPEVLQKVGIEETLSLGFRLKKEHDRILIPFLYAGYKEDEIRLVTGFDENVLHTSMRRVHRTLKAMKRNPPAYLSKPSPWEEQYPLVAPYAFGISVLGIFPQNIHPDSISKLLEDFNVNSLEQLQQQYNVLARFDGCNTHAQTEVLTFMPHAALGSAIYNRTPIDYRDYVVRFEETKLGKKKKRIEVVLEQRGDEYQGHLDSIDLDHTGERLLSKWSMPSRCISVHKYLDSKKLSASLGPLFNQEQRVPYVGIYQAFPLAA